jgi:hypothetical protein
LAARFVFVVKTLSSSELSTSSFRSKKVCVSKASLTLRPPPAARKSRRAAAGSRHLARPRSRASNDRDRDRGFLKLYFSGVDFSSISRVSGALSPSPFAESPFAESPFVADVG